jgi:hypothetical protein
MADDIVWKSAPVPPTVYAPFNGTEALTKTGVDGVEIELFEHVFILL